MHPVRYFFSLSTCTGISYSGYVRVRFNWGDALLVLVSGRSQRLLCRLVEEGSLQRMFAFLREIENINAL
jgi:hypothetical protein